MLMVNATLSNYELNDGCKRARAIVVQGIQVFNEVSEMRPNKQSIIGYILAQLEAKLGSIQSSIAFAEVGKVSQAKIVSALLSACKVSTSLV